MKQKEYKLRLKRSRKFRLFKRFLSLFSATPEVINLSGEPLKTQAIYLSNHEGASGPMQFELYFPVTLTPWGAHEMCEGFKSRWNYLYHVFYQQKLHWNKFKAFTIASLFAPISLLIYRAIGLIGTYHDVRLKTTISHSKKILDANSALLIFPEDSSKGYLPRPTSFNAGFLFMAKTYYKKTKIDLPVYQVYFSKRLHKMIVYKPIYVNQLLEEGWTEEQIINKQLETCHELYDTYVAGK